jgi:hypothetical protein
VFNTNLHFTDRFPIIKNCKYDYIRKNKLCGNVIYTVQMYISNLWEKVKNKEKSKVIMDSIRRLFAEVFSFLYLPSHNCVKRRVTHEM